jgi:peptidoglycan/LPS O-acetylase OafA/YrhL
MPGLDGLRALAVLAVIAYHEFGWAPGGMLGVGVFFTLSGYLITDLLLGQWVGTGRLNLGDFWLRRARRLLPALFVMLALVTAWASVVSPSRLTALRAALAGAVHARPGRWIGRADADALPPGLRPHPGLRGIGYWACGLLVGAALAMVWPSRREAGPARWARVALDGAGIAGLAVIGWMICRVGQ